MTFTKQIALHDRIQIDGEDCSNAFDTFNGDNTDADVDVSGFSVSGNQESLSGARTQSLSGEAFMTPELHALLWHLYKNRTVFPIEWQPDGLVDSSREVWSGNVQLRSYPPTAQRGEVRKVALTFMAADSTGIVCSAGNT